MALCCDVRTLSNLITVLDCQLRKSNCSKPGIKTFHSTVRFSKGSVSFSGQCRSVLIFREEQLNKSCLWFNNVLINALLSSEALFIVQKSFSRTLAFRLLYYQWGKMRTTRNLARIWHSFFFFFFTLHEILQFFFPRCLDHYGTAV